MASLVKGVFVVGAKRTAFGTFGGSLAGKTAVDIAEIAAKAALAQAKVDPKTVDSICFGNVISVSSNDTGYVARHVGLRLGCPVEIPALIINRLCGSGFQSVICGAHDIIMGDSNIVIAGGTESMSQCPFAVRNIRKGTKLGQKYDLDDILWNSLTDLHCKCPMGLTAENLGAQYKLTREECDAYAYASQQKWAKAQAAGYFKEEIVGVPIKVKGKEVMFQIDEHPKPKTPKELFAKLPPAFKKNGIVTAANASGINDGAGAVILASEEALKKYSLKPLARLVAYGISGCDPKIMGIGPVPAINKMMAKAGMKLDDVELIEINEAFAPQVISCAKELKIDMKGDRFNPNGGAIAIGHPLGASGSRICAQVVNELRRRNLKYGIGSACIGGGQGIALLFEKC